MGSTINKGYDVGSQERANTAANRQNSTFFQNMTFSCFKMCKSFNDCCTMGACRISTAQSQLNFNTSI
jgi:hypothetical protein